ncbi:hypothetical protein KY285_028806 [Solanum tuberosum]|nr:hypothetical protein KY289_028982 [Solanum tuberosum]KAH0667600.1 hypothetical protein KY285_028806 [Solanum tuberosum]
MGSGRKYWVTPTEENSSKKDDRSSVHAPAREQISPENFHLRTARGGAWGVVFRWKFLGFGRLSFPSLLMVLSFAQHLQNKR